MKHKAIIAIAFSLSFLLKSSYNVESITIQQANSQFYHYPINPYQYLTKGFIDQEGKHKIAIQTDADLIEILNGDFYYTSNTTSSSQINSFKELFHLEVSKEGWLLESNWNGTFFRKLMTAIEFTLSSIENGSITIGSFQTIRCSPISTFCFISIYGSSDTNKWLVAIDLSVVDSMSTFETRIQLPKEANKINFKQESTTIYTLNIDSGIEMCYVDSTRDGLSAVIKTYTISGSINYISPPVSQKILNIFIIANYDDLNKHSELDGSMLDSRVFQDYKSIPCLISGTRFLGFTMIFSNLMIIDLKSF